ncbi:MAG TPA: pyrroline-5-carboxylate reductase [Geobacteraceae bacterium]|nr:pyrroline-5-carboxylate reductase [Geobacteraceae bacterium]
MLQGKKIGFIGGGNMAEAIIRGLLATGMAPDQITIAEPSEPRKILLADRYKVTVSGDNSAVAANAGVVVLAVKPQVASTVLTQLRGNIGSDTLLISIMAGVSTASIETTMQQSVRVVRVMPNTPALVMEGASALCRGSHAVEEDLTLTEALFAQVGTTCRVDEKLIDAVTGLSGSGPAYVLTFLEALADAGVKNGLSRDAALTLAAQTLLGTAKLYLETGEHPAALRDKVTSPGGTTIAGLYALERGGFRGTVMGAVDAAVARSKELGK